MPKHVCPVAGLLVMALALPSFFTDAALAQP